MALIDATFFDIGSLDSFAVQDSVIHRLDARAKLITTLVFVVCVASFDKYDLSGLLVFFVFPVFLITLADLPLLFFVRRLLIVAPFAMFIGILNPFLDQETVLTLGPLAVSGGWISFASIMVRFTLTVSAALILVATSGFFAVCLALERIKVPRTFSVQLLFLYRYLFVLVDEALRLVRARTLRSFDGRGMGINNTAILIGQLLLRSLARARRIHLAMLCRGFDGEIRLARILRFRTSDVLYTLGWSSAFVIMRMYNVPDLIGGLVTGVLR